MKRKIIYLAVFMLSFEIIFSGKVLAAKKFWGESCVPGSDTCEAGYTCTSKSGYATSYCTLSPGAVSKKEVGLNCSAPDECTGGFCEATSTGQKVCANSPSPYTNPSSQNSSVVTRFDYPLLETFPGFFQAKTTMTDLPTMILSIYKFGIWTVGIAGLFMLVVGGFIYMTSAGNTSTAGNARGIIWDALLGIVAALGAYLILYVINPDLTKINLNFTTVNVEEASEFGGTIVADNGNVATSGGCIKPVKQSRLQGNWVYNQKLKPQTINGIRYTDCSNFVESAYKDSGCSSPGGDTATMYGKAKTWTSTNQLKAGDAIVYNDGRKGHTVLCMTDGCTQVIHSPGTGRPITIKSGSDFTSKSGKWTNAKVIQASSYCGGC